MKRIFSTLLALTLCSGAFASSVQATDAREPMTIGESSSLPLRVLTRPNATLYADKSGSAIVQSNLPTFQSFFVYDKPLGDAAAMKAGWYEVGKDDKGTVVGWIKGEDVFEWKQTMCLTFAHPQDRKPVLMFDKEDDLASLADMDTAARVEKANAYYEAIGDPDKPGTALGAGFPVVSIEPKLEVDKVKQFYLLPILDHKNLSLDGREARLLRIASVGKARPHIPTKEEILKNLKMDIVWVVDTTRSMDPYIEAVRAVMEKASTRLATDSKLKGKIAFGAWGYRDPEEIPGIGYNTKNFTPELQPIDTFLTTLKEVKETKTDSVDVEENVYAGVDDAIINTAWRPDAVRIIVLVGDAPSHEPTNHKWNTSRKDAAALRTKATDNNITLFALHIMPPKTKKYNKIAARQFKILATNRGTDTPAYGSVAGKNTEQFSKNIENIVAVIEDAIDKAVKDKLLEGKADTTDNDDSLPPDLITKTLRAAIITWLGSQAGVQAPRDIEAWVTDKDLIDANRQSLEVNILLNKRQLDSLTTILKDILEAGSQNQISGEDFFTTLQAVSAVAARDADQIFSAGTLADSGLVPEFLTGLPYHSQLMDISNDLWASWAPDEQDAFLQTLEAKCQLYSDIHDNPELWVALNPGDDPSEYVAFIKLDSMP